MGGSVGAHFSELGTIIREVGDARVKVCLDTQHAFAMGYDLTTEDGLEATLTEFKREIGLDRLVACHANDSKVPLGGVRDRHENIGEGHIGRDGFRRIMSHPAFAKVPFIIEVPGFGNQGPDKENVDILKEIRREAAPSLIVPNHLKSAENSIAWNSERPSTSRLARNGGTGSPVTMTRRSEIWLVYHRKASGRPGISYNEAVEEALCFGWIDSQVRNVDKDSFAQRFTPRVLRAGRSQR